MAKEKYLDYPENKNSAAYQYAKNNLESQNLLWSPLSETHALQYLTTPDFGREFMIPDLLSKSKETKWAWDALSRIAQYLLRGGHPFPPELVEWTADVLADQSVKKGEKRRPRPTKGASRMANRDIRLQIVIGHLRCLFDFNATRRDDDPPESACDVVAAVMGMPYKTVEKIWNKRDANMDAWMSELDKQALMKSIFLSERNS